MSGSGGNVNHVSIVADGSGHGGRRYLEESVHCSASPEVLAQPQEFVHHKRVFTEGTGEGISPSQPVQNNAEIIIEEPSAAYFSWNVYCSSYLKKWRGGLDKRLPIPSLTDMFWSWLGAFTGILAVSAMNQWISPTIDIALVVGSFGASAVLIFGMLESKLAQPRNFVGGQILSAIIGVTVRVVIPKPWIAAPVGMSLSLLAMQLTSTTHPPGGATALIAASMTNLPKWHGYSYLITVTCGTVVMLIIALVVNNLAPTRRYPTYWY